MSATASGIILLKCVERDVSAALTDVPPFRKLGFLCSRRFRLSAAPDVTLPDDLVVNLIVENEISAHCEVLMPVTKVECSPRLSTEESGQTQHTLAVSSEMQVLIEGGSWRLRRQGDVSVALEVNSGTDSLTVQGDVPVDSLASTGDHEYHLDFTAEAEVVVVDGTASFVRPLQSVSLSGGGNGKALGGMFGCHANVEGGLEVHREIAECEIEIGGFFESNGPVRLGDRSLRCGDARLNAALESVRDVTCQVLHVEGPIVQAGTLSVASLDCRSALTADRVVVGSDIKVRADAPVACRELAGGGSIVLGGDPSGIASLKWTPASSASQLEIRRPNSRIPSVLVECGTAGGVEPSMHLAAGVEIKRLCVDAYALKIEAAELGPNDESSKKATIGLQLARKDTSLRLSQGMLELRLAGHTPRLALDVASGAKIEVVEIPSDISAVNVRGDGSVRFADLASSALLGHIQLVGRVKFGSSANIDQLSAERWPREAPEASAQDSNPAPSLNLDAGVVVKCASGVCRLDHLQARISGDTNLDFVIENVASRGPTDGHLTNVNVNKLPDDQIPLLTHLRVLEVSGESLKRFASQRTWLRCRAEVARKFLSNSWRVLSNARGHVQQSGRPTETRMPLTSDEIRSRAETAAQLAEMLSGKVNSGSSRARLHWAVARLQHRGLNRRAPERAFRAAYRFVGYGYRPLPALATWAAISFAGLIFGALGGFTTVNEIEFGVAWLWRFIEILLMPIGYLRLGSSGTTAMFDPNAMDLLARLLIGLPFLFSILSIRQYFRSPVGQRAKSET